MSMASGQAELIQAARNGDGAAFADIIRADYAVAFRLAYGLLHDAHEAEDAVQEATFKAWRKLGTLRAGSPLRPWFLAIVANQCRSMRRRRRWSIQQVDEVPDRAAPTVDIAGKLDLRRALTRLAHDERLILVLRYYLDLPFDEIAVTLGITPKAARTRVERAVRRLRPIVRMEEART
jgi:RNA polymerase sigma-70 factor (ECF subfamily)